MSMTSELIKELRGLEIDKEICCYGHQELMNVCKRAADTIEELSAKLHASQMERSLQYYNDGWIPCEDRMPEEKPENQTVEELISMGVRGFNHLYISDEVLVTVHDITEDELFVSAGRTENGKWRDFYKEYNHSYEVLAWQPKPVPYKGKERD